MERLLDWWSRLRPGSPGLQPSPAPTTIRVTPLATVRVKAKLEKELRPPDDDGWRFTG